MQQSGTFKFETEDGNSFLKLKRSDTSSIENVHTLDSKFSYFKDFSDPKALQSLFHSWDLQNVKLVFVFIAHEDDSLKLWNLLMQTAEKAKYYGQELAYVFIAPHGWPCSTKCVKYEAVKCIRVYCQRLEFDFQDDVPVGVAQNDESDEYDLKLMRQEDLAGKEWYQSALHPSCSHYLFTPASVDAFIDVATKLNQHHPLVVIYGDVHHFRSNYKSFVYNLPGKNFFQEILFLCGIWDRTGWDERIRFLHFESLLPDVLLLQMLAFVDIPAESNSLISGNITKVGTLFSKELTLRAENDSIQNIQFCKKYCILNIDLKVRDLENNAGLKKQLFWDDLPDYNCVISMVLTRGKTSKLPIDKNVYEVINGLRGMDQIEDVRPLFVVFDPQGLSFNDRFHKKPQKWSENTTDSTCLTFIPLSVMNTQLGDWNKRPGQSEIFPMQDWNGCVDTYLFVDGEVTIGTEAFTDSFYAGIQKYLLEIIPKKRGMILTPKLLWINFRSKLIRSSVSFQSFPPKHSQGARNMAEAGPQRGSIINSSRPNDEFQIIIQPYARDGIPFIQDMIQLALFELLFPRGKYNQETMTIYSPLCQVIPASKNLVFRFDNPVSGLKFQLKLCWFLIISNNQRTISSHLKDLYLSFTNIFTKAGDALLLSNDELVASLLVNLIYEISDKPFPKCVRHPQIKNVLSSKMKSTPGSKIVLPFIEPMDYNTTNLTSDPVSDLFYASVIGGNCIASEELLPYTKPREVIANALYAVGVFKNEILDTQPESPLAVSEEERDRYEHSTTILEKHAMEIIQQVYSKNKKASQSILFEEIPRFGGNSTFDLACMAQTRSFLSDKACTTAIKDFFWGDYGDCSVLMLLLFMVMPCFTPAYVRKQQKALNNPSADVTWYDIYSVPAAKCLVHYLVFIFHTGVYTYLVLTQLGNEISPAEYVIFLWICTLLIREIIQFRSALGLSQGLSFRQKFKMHYARFWNILDLIIMTLYFIALIIRIVGLVLDEADMITTSQIIFAANAFPMFVRTCHYYSMQDKIGPLLITIRYMFSDLMSFIVIMFVVLFGYGVALQAILFPQAPLDLGLLNGVMHIPYFQIFGEIFAEEIEEANLDPGNGDPGYRNYISLFLAGFYLLLTNILLLNLLIALFNSSYERVEGDSVYHNILQKIDFIREFNEDHIFPPPLNLLYYIFVMPIKLLVAKKDAINRIDDSEVEQPEIVSEASAGTQQESNNNSRPRSTRQIKVRAKSARGKKFDLPKLVADYFRRQQQTQEDNRENRVLEMRLRMMQSMHSEQNQNIKGIQKQMKEVLKILHAK